MHIYPNFDTSIQAVGDLLREASHIVPAKSWQSTDISSYGEAMHMRELFNVSYQVMLTGHNSLRYWREDIKPSLPWADNHFEERISGCPLNPGEQWAKWPYGHSANRHRTNGQFSHTYMERYWPKIAHSKPSKTVEQFRSDIIGDEPYPFNKAEPTKKEGIRYPYGDLNDLIDLLARDPLTRQAFLPVWFPEDTGVVHGERAPCTLGYHFLLRSGFFHCTYYIRSCDFVRHYRDDLYLSLRLMIHILDELAEKSSDWLEVNLGSFTFHCVSLHCFQHDWDRLFGGENGEKNEVSQTST